MSLNRREFLTAAAGGALLVTGGNALARPNKPVSPEAVGMLYDATLCIGCKACIVGCRAANEIPPETPVSLPIWDAPKDLSSRTFNVIKLYKDGTAETKDQVTDGYAFIKRNCPHCVDANCVSVCPVSAMRKDPITGIVTHHPDVCIGCRYCIFACPFNIPKYELHDAFGEITKCQFCNHRLKQGKLPGCVEACPTGANIFGPRAALLEEARRRIALKPGDEYEYPLRTLDSQRRHVKQAPTYQQHVYGEKELGGTQILYLSGVPFEKLGLPKLPERSFASQSEAVQHTIYKYMALPALAFAGLLYTVRRNTKAGQGSDQDRGEPGATPRADSNSQGGRS
jgi:Fe-S-cluster-containing dehydrogenase component